MVLLKWFVRFSSFNKIAGVATNIVRGFLFFQRHSNACNAAWFLIAERLARKKLGMVIKNGVKPIISLSWARDVVDYHLVVEFSRVPPTNIYNY